jgi:hypothetical protein
MQTSLIHDFKMGAIVDVETTLTITPSGNDFE